MLVILHLTYACCSMAAPPLQTWANSIRVPGSHWRLQYERSLWWLSLQRQDEMERFTQSTSSTTCCYYLLCHPHFLFYNTTTFIVYVSPTRKILAFSNILGIFLKHRSIYILSIFSVSPVNSLWEQGQYYS